MKHTFIIIALACLGLYGCKTSEENYRSAYEKAVAGRAERIDLDSTIYGKHRRNMTMRQAVVGTDTVEVKTQHVRITADGGGIPEYLKKYNVVVGQFKTLFNAKSMRERLVDAGYARTFVVETAEPYYYVVVFSEAHLDKAVAAMEDIAEQDFPVTLREPLPFILQTTR